eukprot:529909-Rhodomonas_salina.4
MRYLYATLTYLGTLQVADIRALKPVEGKEDVAPFLIGSFDIECSRCEIEVPSPVPYGSFDIETPPVGKRLYAPYKRSVPRCNAWYTYAYRARMSSTNAGQCPVQTRCTGLGSAYQRGAAGFQTHGRTSTAASRSGPSFTGQGYNNVQQRVDCTLSLCDNVKKAQNVASLSETRTA